MSNQNKTYTTQNELLLNNLLKFYNKDNNLEKILPIINGESKLSIRIIDWFVTNYSKKNYVVYNVLDDLGKCRRFKVYVDYKLKLKAYSKRRFDPFCRWERITIPYNNNSYIQTTIGQLNFFKWTLDNKIIEYIENNIVDIEKDMNTRNSTAKKSKKLKKNMDVVEDIADGKEYLESEEYPFDNNVSHNQDEDEDEDDENIENVENKCGEEKCKSQKQNLNNKTRKKREELSISAIKSIKKEDVKIVVKFN